MHLYPAFHIFACLATVYSSTHLNIQVQLDLNLHLIPCFSGTAASLPPGSGGAAPAAPASQGSGVDVAGSCLNKALLSFNIFGPILTF